MAMYPTPESMAKATEQEVLKAWEGLGYYRRARNLHAAAKAITFRHGGIFPTDHAEILDLPGIGPYTAGAVASFAYNDSQPIVDANVARVFTRLFNYRQRIDTGSGQKQLWEWAATLVAPSNPRSYNSALMELGQSYCSNQSPDCVACPVRHFCHCLEPASLPIKKAATAITQVDEFAIFSQDSHGRILLEQQKKGGRREGMWTLPRRDKQEIVDLSHCYTTTYSITRYRVTLRIFSSPTPPTTPTTHEEWFVVHELESLPMPSPDRRALESILTQ